MGTKEGYLPLPDDFETICIHHAAKLTKEIKHEKCRFGTPIVMSNFCKDESLGSMSEQYHKSRLTNSTRSTLEKLVALLNRAKYGLTFASGMGAISAVLGLLKCGDEILCCDDHYGGTYELTQFILPKYGIKTFLTDFDDEECIKKAITDRTKILWMETPTNPRMKVVDLCACVKIAKECNILTVVDNSFLTPYMQRPLEFGIDIVIQAMAKFMNGHSDVVVGAVSTNRDDLYDQLKWIQRSYGEIPSPFDCYQVMRGLKTLPLRMKRQHSNVIKIAEWLEKHPKISGLRQPALKSHPRHELFKSQTSGTTRMLSFHIKGQDKDSLKFMKNLKIFYTAVSLGGYESLVQPPFFLTHKNTNAELAKKLEYTPNLVRMAIGLEDPDDLIKDLDQSLSKL